MPDEGKINARQAGLLMFSFLMGSAILMIPSAVTSLAEQDGWLSVVIASLFGLVFILLYTQLGLLFPRQSIVQYSETILGKWAGKIVGLLYIWYFFHLATIVTRNFSDFVIGITIPDTPMLVISGSFIVVIAYAIRGGIETLGRVNELMIPVRELFVLLVIILSIRIMNTENLAPFMANGMIPVLKGGMLVTSFPFGETILFAMLIPNISNQHKVKKSYVVSMLTGGFFLTLAVLVTVLVLGPSITSRFIFPYQSVIRDIEAADFITNLDSIGMLLWTSSGFVKIAVCYYCTVIGIGQWCGISDYRPIVTPVGILIVIFSLTVFESTVENASFDVTVWPFYSLPFNILIPLAMLIVAKIRRLDGKGQGG
jgi:spore germination protein KB